jgi:hypothetical protein
MRHTDGSITTEGMPRPDWMTKGIPRIKMDEYWQQLKAQQAGPTIVP